MLAATSSQATSTDVRLTLPDGPIVGSLVPSHYHQTEVNQFLGIPYARPPVGELRFRRPVPVEPWSSPLEAKHWPNSCPQLITPIDGQPAFANSNFTEDCLYLNVWSPSVENGEDKLLPVLFFIHGGGLVFGSSSFDLYSGQTLASVANAVVVTTNYR